MANDKDPKEFANAAKEMQEALARVEKTLSRMGALFGGIEDKSSRVSKNAKEQSDYYEKGGKQLSQIRDLNAELNKQLEDENKSQKVKNLALKTGLDVRVVELRLAKQQAIAEAERSGASKEVVKALRMQYDQALKLTQEKVKQEKLQESEKESLERLKDATAWQEKYKNAVRNVIDVLKTPQLARAVFAEQAISKLGKLKDSLDEFKSMGVSSAQAVEAQFKTMTVASILGLSDTKGVMKGVIEQYGNVNALSKNTVNELGKMSKEFGISGEQAAEVNAALSKMPGETSETAANAMKHVGAMAKMQGIAPGKIMKDMAKNTEAMALFGGKGAKEFGKTAIELHKMGIEISTASKMAQGLLNFEDSINKQLEASVLLNREVNFDKAREYALQGKIAEAAQEVVKQAGGEAEWGRMNVLQKQKLAEAAGMTVEEMQKQIDAQKEHNKYFGEEAGLMANALGHAMKYGSAAAGFLKENGMLMASMLQLLGRENIVKMGMWVKEKAHAAWRWATMQREAAMSKVSGGGGGGLAGGAAESMKKVGGAAGGLTPAAGGGAKKALKDIAGGVKAFGSPKVLLGAVGMVAAAVGLAAMLAGVPTVLLLSIPGIGIGFRMNMQAIGQALSQLGSAAANPMTWLGIALLAAFGAALIPLTFALSLLAPVIEAFGNVILKVFTGVSILVKAVAEAFVMIFKAFAENWKILIPVGFGLMAVGAGMLTLGAAAFMAFPGLMMAALGLGLMIPGLVAITLAGKLGGIQLAATALQAIGQSAVGLAMVGVSMLAIGAGLGLIAMAGLMAMPVLGMLIALATVAPALIGVGAALGGMFGGKGGGKGKEEEDKMDILIARIDRLISVAEKGGTINMDGKKVGEVVRLSLNSSGVR